MSKLSPISENDRLVNVDVIRGAALLGILMMNIPLFAMQDYYSEPWSADTSNINFWYDAVVTTLFEGKMRALFSMIFGVGILLFTMRKEDNGWQVTGLYYKRMVWLILFGLADAHLLLWIGDILYVYGVCGLIAYLFRKMKPIYLAAGIPLVSIIGFTSSTYFLQGIRTQLLAYNDAKAAQEKNTTLTDTQQKALANWREVEKEFIPNKEDAADHTRKMKSDYATVASYIRPEAWKAQTEYLVYEIWDPLALMLLGMALFKWGFLSGEWPRKKYLKTLFVGYGIGLPLVIFSYAYNVIHVPTTAAFLRHLADHPVNWVDLTYDAQRILISLGHASAILLVLKSGVLSGFTNRLATVGRMAFTNYVMQSIFCSLIFFGYGLNFFGELEYYQLFYVVAAVWLFQLWLSPLWLKGFLFGPLEWLWRTLTYWKIQPFRRHTPGT